MFKHVNSLFFFLVIILPIVLCQSDSSTTAAPDQTSPAETSTKTPIPTNQTPPKDVKTTVSRLTQSNQVIEDAKLSPVATGVKILLTPVVYLVRGLLFVVELLLKGVLILVKGLVDGLVKALGLAELLPFLDPTLESVTKLITYLLHSVSCLLASLAYGPALMECPPKPIA
ncbi:hypothetical protein HCN44_006671 [Aphidius gifuensis]|uniref:Odorant-binding protein n=1 Tax=Aphidius gifuensis TaxID=684658 RepID=A0A835CT19_APHGI|nr:uncharacterized protein LOC122850012 [Aphidius gifuensis]KAF7995564.1 hypothetical protein HCN44_006671 [Aphidius gifuensis]